MAMCGIAFGGNLGNTVDTFRQALRLLDGDDIRITSVSRFITTPPMGADAGGDFLNAVAVVETELAPLALLTRLHEFEAACGRTRQIRWGPRHLDLDLLFCDQVVICTDQIVVPHPLLWCRRFVLNPLREIAPDYVHPILRETVSQLCDRLEQRPLHFGIDGDRLSAADVRHIEQQLQSEFGPKALRLSRLDGASVNVECFAIMATDSSTSSSQCGQPPHEIGRLIRVPAGIETLPRRCLTVLRETCAAALG